MKLLRVDHCVLVHAVTHLAKLVNFALIDGVLVQSLVNVGSHHRSHDDDADTRQKESCGRARRFVLIPWNETACEREQDAAGDTNFAEFCYLCR